MTRLATAALIAGLVFGFAVYVRAHPITIITPDDFAWWEAELASTTT